MISVIVNGKPRELGEPQTVLAFLQANGINPHVVAVELSGEILRREEFGDHLVQDGAKLEIVRMIGGG
ncbi:MAG: sulfur carrier protein ThiS [Chloroflexi bacterium]|nr:sulfur carrier protein ThiS [Chloroflexota bacterium]